MIKVGIECENLEDPKSRWGVGQLTFNLLKEYSENSELQKKFKLYLYFKKIIPDDDFLKNPIFIKRVLGFPSFNIFYHILMPLRAMADRLDWMFFPAYQLPPLYFGKSIVMLTPDVYYEYKFGSLPFRYRLSYAIFTNWAAKFATKIMAISETSKGEVAKLYKIKPEKIFTNYLGIDQRPTTNPFDKTSTVSSVEPLRVLSLSKNDQRPKDSIVNGHKLSVISYLLYVGQMFPRRHARETILAFKKLIMEHSYILKNVRILDLKLIMIGKDKYNPPIIEDLIRRTNHELGSEVVIHYDYIEDREDMEKLYASAKALVYVSDREAFGLPPMEALAFGVPPIVMDNELGHELYGEYAFYVKSGSVEDIADAIRQTLDNEQGAMSIRNSGPEFVKKYSWSNFRDQFFEKLNV